MADQMDLFGPPRKPPPKKEFFDIWGDFGKKKPSEKREALAVEGMAAAMEHADAVSFESIWTNDAREGFYQYMLLHHDETFTSEDIRIWLEETHFNIAHPPDSRSWGGIMRSASDFKLIEATGRSRNARKSAAHGGPKREWIYIASKATCSNWVGLNYQTPGTSTK